MDTTITAISRFAPKDISMDFERLRTEGITHLEDLATYIWTDFNAHDPGITILEVLCYAITDLGYRANLPIEDLLASNSGSLEASFFPATAVLPVCPITQNDYRKLLIDFPGVRNAWVERVYPNDTPILLNKDKIELNQDSILEKIAKKFRSIAFPDVEEKVRNAVKKYGIKVSVEKIKKNLEEILNTVTATGSEELKKGQTLLIQNFLTFLLAIAPFYENAIFYYKRKFKENATENQLNFIDSWNLTDQTISVLKEIDLTDIASYYDIFLEIDRQDIPEVIRLLNKWLCKYSYYNTLLVDENGNPITDSEININDYQKICLNGLYRICIDTHQDLEPNSKAARKLIEKIQKGYTDNSTNKQYKGLCDYRNLGEDVHDVQIASNQKINLCLDISVAEDANEEEVMAEVIFRLQDFFTPSVKFYTLQQLLKKGRSCDEIFNGPLLCNGFIDDEELEQAILPNRIRLSDLYKIILDTPQVLTVNSLKTALFREGTDETEFGEEDEWCFPDKNFNEDNPLCPIKPIIELRKSKLCVVKNGISTEIKENDIADRISLLRLASRNLVGNASNQIEIQNGTFRPDLADYLSVQYEFPHNYMIGENGVPDQASPLRKAQAKQLQAYLLFFDRLLGDYLKQLSQVQNLLSVQQDAESATYFYQSLYHVPGIRDLINDSALDQIQTEDAWEAYQNEDNHYIKKLKQIVETPDMRFNRKHRILNHLLARFGEQFTAYSIQIFKTRQHHLASKADFLKALPELGLERAKAYNYKAKKESGEPDVWTESQNVAGLKKRLYKLLGWGDATTESVFNNPSYRIDEERDMSGNFPRYYLVLNKLNEEGRAEESLLRSEKAYTRRKINGFEKDLKVWINNARAGDPYYDVVQDEENTNLYRVEFRAPSIDNGADVVLHSTNQSEEEARLLFARIKELVNVELKNNFHLLEHILLRPNDPKDALLQMAYTCDLQFAPVDPYSFWISVLLPAWKGQFQDMEYRNYFMQLVRRETPAHLAICFRWVESEDDMENLEHALEQWREALAKCTVDECDVTEKAKNLVVILNNLPCDCYCFSTENASPKC